MDKLVTGISPCLSAGEGWTIPYDIDSTVKASEIQPGNDAGKCQRRVGRVCRGYGKGSN